MKPPGEDNLSAEKAALEMLASALKAGRVARRLRNNARTRGALDVMLTPASEAKLWAILNDHALAAPVKPSPEKPASGKLLTFKAKENCKP